MQKSKLTAFSFNFIKLIEQLMFCFSKRKEILNSISIQKLTVRKQKTKTKTTKTHQNSIKQLCLFEAHTWLPPSLPWPWTRSRIVMLRCSRRTGSIWLFLFLLPFWRGLFWDYSISFGITTLHTRTEGLRIKTLRFKNKKIICLVLPLMTLFSPMESTPWVAISLSVTP